MAHRNAFKLDLDSLPTRYRGLVAGLEEISTLEHLFAWIRAGGERFGAIDLLAQDEFSHDMVVECFPDPDLQESKVYLAFGST